jgi:hypothetical protein
MLTVEHKSYFSFTIYLIKAKMGTIHLLVELLNRLKQKIELPVYDGKTCTFWFAVITESLLWSLVSMETRLKSTGVPNGAAWLKNRWRWGNLSKFWNINVNIKIRSTTCTNRVHTPAINLQNLIPSQYRQQDNRKIEHCTSFSYLPFFHVRENLFWEKCFIFKFEWTLDAI